MASIPQVPEIEDQDLAYYLEQLNLYLASQQPGANVVLNTDDTANFSGGYLNRYLAIAYANSASGLDFSNTQANRAFFATYNSNSSVWSSNPADYVYFETNQGFGSARNLYYQVLGGRQIAFNVNTTAPVNYAESLGSQVIDLDQITVTGDLESITVVASPGTLSFSLVENNVSSIFGNLSFSLNATAGLTNVSYVIANTDSSNAFVNNSIRIGANAGSGANAVTSTFSNIVIYQTVVGTKGSIVIDAVGSSNANVGDSDTITFPIRYKNSQGIVYQVPEREVSVQYVDLPGYSVDTASGTGSIVTLGSGSSIFDIAYTDIVRYVQFQDYLGRTDFGADTVFCDYLNVGGITSVNYIFCNDYISTPNLEVFSHCNIDCLANIANSITVSGNANVGQNLFVTGNANVSSNIAVTGNISLAGDLLYTETGTPANTTSVVGYVRIVLNGANAYIPYYQ